MTDHSQQEPPADPSQNQENGAENSISEEALLFGHLTLSMVPQEVIQVIFHFGVTKVDQLRLLNKEILD